MFPTGDLTLLWRPFENFWGEHWHNMWRLFTMQEEKVFERDGRRRRHPRVRWSAYGKWRVGLTTTRYSSVASFLASRQWPWVWNGRRNVATTKTTAMVGEDGRWEEIEQLIPLRASANLSICVEMAAQRLHLKKGHHSAHVYLTLTSFSSRLPHTWQLNMLKHLKFQPKDPCTGASFQLWSFLEVLCNLWDSFSLFLQAKCAIMRNTRRNQFSQIWTVSSELL